MKSAYKPEGYTSVAPYLIVPDAAKTIEFMVAALGGKELRRFAEPSGRIGHAEVRIDDTVVMLGNSTESWPPVPCHVHVYVADVDATYKKALTAGAHSVQEPVQKGDADKRGGVKDSGGTTWWIATKID